MSAIDDLNAEETKLAAAVSGAVTLIGTLFADLKTALAGGNDAAIEAAVAAMDQQISTLNAAVTANPAPTAPATPVAPSTPSTPATPASPSAPAVSTTPASPSTATPPAGPATPTTPAAPTTPPAVSGS